MSSLKTKEKKKIITSKNVTLDSKYNHKIKYFKESKKSLKDKKKLLSDYKINLSELNNNVYLSDDEWDKKNKLKDTIFNLEKEIDEIENFSKENEYYLDAGDILFKYYNCLNNTNTNLNIYKEKNKNNSNSNSIVNLLYRDNEITQENDETNDIIEDYCTKAELLDKYMNTVENLPIKNFNKNDVFYCSMCNNEKKIIPSEGIVFCPICGNQENILIECEKPSYKDPPKEISYFAYKRINHFNEWLCQIQGKETTDIPQDILNMILIELKKERIDNVADIKTSKLKEILKKLHANKYYEHTAHIINKINGIPAPNIPKDLEERLRSMFKDIQIPFMKNCPTHRKNFLSYSYVLHKFIQLLERDEFLKHFPLLKSREKLHEQDLIWKKICAELNWQFIKSI